MSTHSFSSKISRIVFATLLTVSLAACPKPPTAPEEQDENTDQARPVQLISQSAREALARQALARQALARQAFARQSFARQSVARQASLARVSAARVSLARSADR